MPDKARVVNVILVETGANRAYFTLEGIEIGSFIGGKVVKPALQEAFESPKSAVTKSLSPAEVKREQAKRNDSLMDIENRIPIND